MAVSPKYPIVHIADANGNVTSGSVTGSDGSSTIAVSIGGSPTVAVALTGSDQAVSASAKDYRGFTVRETAGATAVLVIYDNASTNSGTILENIGLLANESRSEFYPAGVKTSNGIYVDIVSGTVAGSVRTG